MSPNMSIWSTAKSADFQKDAHFERNARDNLNNQLLTHDQENPFWNITVGLD
jgi:hypothetical protein